MRLPTTQFGAHFVEATHALALAAESDGTEMQEYLQRAYSNAELASKASYEHSPVEKIMATNLVALVDSVRYVIR